MPAKYWNLMTREEISAAIGGAVVMIPTGATEQHGPHLPTGLDTFAVTEIAKRSAEIASRDTSVIVAPTQQFGSSAHHVPFGGTLTLSTDTYYQTTRDLVNSVLDAGGSKVVLVNGHGGNVDLNRLVARDVVLERQAVGKTVAAAAISWWDLSLDELRTLPGVHPDRIPGHAGEIETSIMLAIQPELVREPRPQRDVDPVPAPVFPGPRLEFGNFWRRFDGFMDFPDRATAATGQRVLDVVVRDLAVAIVAIGRAEL